MDIHEASGLGFYKGLRWLLGFFAVSLVFACLSCELHGEHSNGGAAPSWNEATKASCWDGANAEVRMMNILSPTMPDAMFKERVRWMKDRGCNAAHVFICNRENGDHAGYSPWGVGTAPSAAPCDEKTTELMRSRIRHLRHSGFAVVVWVMSDDSAPWAHAIASNAEACLQRIKEAGLLDDASTVVAGLEMDEYWSSAEAARVVCAIRSVYGGKVGVHHTDGRAPFAALCDILFYQTAPGKTAAQISSDARKALSYGKPVNFFELDRHPNRALCEAALAAGCYGVGNW